MAQHGEFLIVRKGLGEFEHSSYLKSIAEKTYKDDPDHL